MNYVGVVWKLAIICILLASRFYQLEKPEFLCWDEVHFVDMASLTSERKCYFDLHPPLGKLLYAAVTKLTGYAKSNCFQRSISAEAPFYNRSSFTTDFQNPCTMFWLRSVSAFCGVLTVLVFGLTVAKHNGTTAGFVTLVLLVFDTGSIVLSRYALLDCPLLLFISLCFWAACRHQQSSKQDDSTLSSWNLLVIGFTLGLATSVKLVGLFTAVLVALRLIHNISQQLLMSGCFSCVNFIRQLFNRCILSALAALSVYCAVSVLHLLLMQFSGPGDVFFSSGFQAKLQGNRLNNATIPKYLVTGSRIALRSVRPATGFLSYFEFCGDFSSDSQTQTCDDSVAEVASVHINRDQNYAWLLKASQQHGESVDQNDLSNNRLKFGSTVSLNRRTRPGTIRRLCCIDFGDFSDGHCVLKLCSIETFEKEEVFSHWLIKGGVLGQPIRTIIDQIYFQHVKYGCVLTATGRRGSDWNPGHTELVCRKSSEGYNDCGDLWTFESFSVDGKHNVSERQQFCGPEENRYLSGNPVVWSLNLVVLLCFTLVVLFRFGRLFFSIMRKQHLFSRIHGSDSSDFAIWLYVGWLLHFAPFFVMDRALYFHHYFAAFMFSCMLSGVVVSQLLNQLPDRFRSCCLFLFVCAVVLGFLKTVHFAYGVSRID